MDSNQWLMAIAGLALGAAAAWGGAVWWFGRMLKQAAARLDKTEKARQFAATQTTQARKQIESLQHELGELRHAAQHKVHINPPAPSGPEMMLPVGGTAPRKPAPGDGFADTQVLLPSKR
ncbi:hypothetical protein [Paucibacter soli]|uniref:hypothetical protein n=1 Tax=Paucibacter soli TaxID=3133433 RepID=UPI00309A5B4E